MAAHRLAIDLGTSHTVAVVRRDGAAAPRSLLFDGSPLLPSAVFSEPPRLHVGRDAERLALVDPGRFEPHPKRRVDDGSVLLGSTEVRVVDMLAELLRRVVAEAAHAGVPAGEGAVLTCPADWAVHRRSVLLDAARAAGLGPVDLVEEPVAAATYCISVLGQQVGVGGTVAVFDFGGGTLDASVLRRDPDGLRVLSVGGLDNLGGVDVDAALVGHLGQLIALRSPRVWQRISAPGGPSEQRERRQFWNEVRGAKEMLSRAAVAPIQVPGLDSAVHLTREELERIAGPLIDRAVDETRRVLQRCGVEAGELAGLLLVGGSSRIPLVASRLHTRFGVAPIVPEQPELPVAYGGLIAVAGPAAAGTRREPAPAPPHPPTAQPVSTPPAWPKSPTGATPSFPMSYPPVPASPSITFPPARPIRPPPPPPPPPGGPSPGPSLGPPLGPQGWPPGAPHGAPPGRPMAPTMVPPRAPRRHGRLRVVIPLVVLALIAVCGGGAYAVYRSAVGLSGGAGNGSGASNLSGDGGNLEKLASVTVPGAGAMGVTVGPSDMYYAGVDAGHLRVTALTAADGNERWSRTFDVEPAELTLRQVGDVLVVHGGNAATHQGKDIRLLIDARTGDQKRLDVTDGQRAVAYIGGDIIVESPSPDSRPPTVQRIDLGSGVVEWTVDVKREIVHEPHMASPLLVHAPDVPGGPQDSAIALPVPAERPDAAQWRPALAADPGIVVTLHLDDQAVIRDADTGKAKVSGAAPLDPRSWIAYSGVVVGRLSDRASPGRTMIAAFGTDNLAKRWEYPLPAGATVERIKPCGPHHLCVAQRGSGGGWTASAIDVTTGKDAWTRTADLVDEPDWYLMSAGLIYGKSSFGHVEKASRCDPESGAKTHDLVDARSYASVVAGAGRRGVLRRPPISTGAGWTMSVVDFATGRTTSTLTVSDKMIKHMAVLGDVAVAVSDDRKLVAGKAPATG